MADNITINLLKEIRYLYFYCEEAQEELDEYVRTYKLLTTNYGGLKVQTSQRSDTVAAAIIDIEKAQEECSKRWLYKKEKIYGIKDKIDSMEEEYKLILTLYYIRGKTIREIARKMNYSPSTICDKLKKGANILFVLIKTPDLIEGFCVKSIIFYHILTKLLIFYKDNDIILAEVISMKKICLVFALLLIFMAGCSETENQVKYTPINSDNYSKSNNTIYYPLYANITGNSINVISKYNATQDLRVNFNNVGINSIFNFANIYLISNSTEIVSSDITLGTVMEAIGSDWLGPHKLLAVDNIDGDLPSSTDFTGGYHGYSGGQTGVATGRTSAVQFYADGRKYTTFSGYANYIDIYWTNYVQASNTKKADGTGREVLQENFHIHYAGDKYEVDCNIKFLEAVTWNVYYGLQCTNTAWRGYVFYHSSANRKWNDATIYSNSAGEACNLITLYKDNNWLDMGLDISHGIGDRSLLTGMHGALTYDYSKTYFNLVNATSMSAGDVVTYRGYYRFYNK